MSIPSMKEGVETHMARWSLKESMNEEEKNEGAEPG